MKPDYGRPAPREGVDHVAGVLAHTPGIFPDRREIFIAAGKHRSRLDTEILI